MGEIGKSLIIMAVPFSLLGLLILALIAPTIDEYDSRLLNVTRSNHIYLTESLEFNTKVKAADPFSLDEILNKMGSQKIIPLPKRSMDSCNYYKIINFCTPKSQGILECLPYRYAGMCNV